MSKTALVTNIGKILPFQNQHGEKKTEKKSSGDWRQNDDGKNKTKIPAFFILLLAGLVLVSRRFAKKKVASECPKA